MSYEGNFDVVIEGVGAERNARVLAAPEGLYVNKHQVPYSTLLGVALIPCLMIKTFAAAVIVAVFVGFGLAGILLIWDVIISDIIDEDELHSGVRREGMYFGMNAFIIRFAIAMQAATIGLVLTFSRYQPANPVQSGLTILGFRLLIAGIPVLGLVVGFIAMRMYPLFGERLAHIKAELRKRRVH